MQPSQLNPLLNQTPLSQQSAQQFEAKQELKLINTLIKDMMNTADEGSLFVGGGIKAPQEGDKKATPLRPQHQPGKPEFVPSGAEAVAAEAAGIDDAEKLKKKKRKKQEETLKKLMAKLSNLEGAYNLDQLEDEDRQIVESFFKNMGSIKHLKKELQFLIDKEKRYQEIIDASQKRSP
jgi:hypothetical protein